MKLKYLLPIILFLLFPLSASALPNFHGWCEVGASFVTTSGIISTTQVQASYPVCTVTVYIHGGGSATIYSDGNKTSLANPFTANTNGQWMFYALEGRYDIQLSGAGFPVPVTYSDVILTDNNTNINNNIYIDGVIYPNTASGINSADLAIGASPGIIFVTLPGSYCDTTVLLSNLHTLQFSPGTYILNIAGADSNSTNVTWGVVGPGNNQAIIQSCPGSNKDVITSQHFSSFTGGTNFWGVFSPVIANLTLDGNKTSETAGYVLRFYGRGESITNLTIQNGYSGGLWTEWKGTETDSQSANDLESYITNLKTIYNGGNGWTHKGPNDLTVHGFKSYENGCWGWEVDSPTHASHVNTYENDLTAPGTCGGIHEANQGGLAGNDIVGSSATGWGMLVDTTAGANIISSGSWGGFAAIGLETRNGGTVSQYQGACENENSGVDCLKINGSGDGIYIIGFAANIGNHNINFVNEVTPNTIIANTDGTSTGWYIGSPTTSDTLFLGAIPGHPSSGFYQFGGGIPLTLGITTGIGTAAPFTGNTGFQHQTVGGCTTGAGLNATCTTTITWTAPFLNNSYDVSCSGVGVSAGLPLIQGVVPGGGGASVTVTTINMTAVAASFGAISCVAVHP